MARNKYAVGGLQGCLVSVTGVAFEERARICAMVQELGGIYSPELKPQCSHLIFEDLNGDNNIAFTASQNQLPIKVQYALKWDIPVVSKAWIYACHRERILLEESEYPAMSKMPLDDSEESAEVLPVKLHEIREDTPGFLQGCHVYLNGDSISSQRLAVLKRLVLAAGGVRYTDLDTGNLTHIVIHNQLLPNHLKVFLEAEGEGEGQKNVRIVHDNWLFDSFKEARRLPETDYEVSQTTTKKQMDPESKPTKWKSAFSQPQPIQSGNSSFLNANANISFGNPRTSLAGGEEFLAGTPNVLETAAKVLKGKTVYLGMLKDEGRARKLASKARRCGMKIAEEVEEADWCITHVLINNNSKNANRKMDLRNEIWFEAALDSKAQLPSSSFARPFHCANPLSLNLSTAIFSQSGFTGPEREFYAEVIRSSGAQYTDSLSKANTHLLIEEPRSGSKFEFARKWKIQCVDVEWFKRLFEKENCVNGTESLVDNHNNNANNNNTYNNTFSYNKPQSLVFNSQPTRSAQPTKESVNSVDNASLLKGLVFASSQRLWHRRDELSALVESLGGVFLWSFDRSCTHYLHQGKVAEEAFKEFKQARQWDKFIVSPWWVFKCKEQGMKVDEARYPHTYKEESEGTTTMMVVDTETHSAPTTIQPVVQSVSNNKYSNHSQPAPNTLDWDAILAERRAQELLLRPGSKTFNIESHPAFMKSERTTTTSVTGKDTISNVHRPPHKWKVVFSGYTSGEKGELMKILGERSDLEAQEDEQHVDWNPRSTILICNTLNFTEKIFSACATGCWILKKEFLLDRSTDFEKYELGPAWNASERDALIGKAPKYWRQRLSAGGSGNERNSSLLPFSGWKCALSGVEASRQVLYESVLRNGGAEVIRDLNASLIPQITHFFCSNIKAIPETLRNALRAEQIFSTKHITNTIFRLNDD